MEFKDGQTVGVDLGTTFSTIAQLDEDGAPVALPNEDEEVETPSLILLTDSHHVVVGPNRMRAAMENPGNVVERIKRRMGDTDYHRSFDGKEITPEFLSALILKKLRQDAEKRIGKIGNAVITVPYYFNDARRKATQDAGRIAGFNVVDIINEPTAATLTYAWHRGELGAVGSGTGGSGTGGSDGGGSDGGGSDGAKPRLALIFDLGGGTFDVTMVRYTPTHFQVLATDGDVQLGGIDWSDRILDHVAEEFKAKHGLDIRESPQTVHTLQNDCDLAKLDLTEAEKTKLICRYEGKAASVAITREEFESKTADLLQRTADTTRLVLSQAGIESGSLDAVVMVGGSTLMPQVPRMLKEVTGIEPYTGLSPHTAVAQGAAIHAAILEAKHRGNKSELADKVRKMLSSIKQENVNSHGLGIVAANPKSGKEINHVMIKKNTRLPVEISQTFKTRREAQDRVSVQVIEGDAPDPAACSLLGKCRITGLPDALPKGSPIEVTYAFNEAGRIVVKAREKTGGKEAVINIERRGGLDEKQIDSFTNLAHEYQVD